MQCDCTAYCDRQKVLPVTKPGTGVWPRQSCATFVPRKEHLPTNGSQCWFCRYGHFHLTHPVALEVGSCCWLETQME